MVTGNQTARATNPIAEKSADGAITIANGAVEQKNFDGFRVLRMNEMPTVEVHLVDSDEAPSGLGEPGVPPIAPAVANALFALNRRRIRKLPMVT